jgi:hypothetical protein
MSGAAGQLLLDALMIQAGRSCRRAYRVIARLLGSLLRHLESTRRSMGHGCRAQPQGQHGLSVRAVDSQVRR